MTLPHTISYAPALASMALIVKAVPQQQLYNAQGLNFNGLNFNQLAAQQQFVNPGVQQ